MALHYRLDFSVKLKFFLKTVLLRSSLVAQQVKNPALPLQWLGSLLWYGFHPWLRTSKLPHTVDMAKKKKKQFLEDRLKRNINQMQLKILNRP